MVGFREGFGGGFHFRNGDDFFSEEDFGFREVWRDDTSQGDEGGLVGLDGFVFEEACAGGGDHDGIDNELDLRVVFEDGCNEGHELGRAEHSGFYDCEGE